MRSALHDQAEGLRRLLDRHGLRVLLVSAGADAERGGASAVVNLAAALADLGRDVLVLDGPSGRLTQALGLSTRHDLADVIKRQRSLDEIVLRGPGRIRVLPLGRVAGALARLTEADQQWLLERCSRLSFPIDTLVADGAEQGDIWAGSASQHLVLVHGAGGAAVMSAYAAIKRMHLEADRREFHLVIDDVADAEEAQRVFDNLAQVARRYLKVSLRLLGHVPRDEKLGQAARLNVPVVTAFPSAPAARSFKAFAESIAGWPLSECDGNGFDDFMRRMLGWRSGAAAGVNI